MEFTERKVLILVKSRPYGEIINFEGWRAAVGMFGMDHEPMLLFMGDGVFSLLKTADAKPFRMFKATYIDFDGRILASKKSLEERIEILEKKDLKIHIFLTFSYIITIKLSLLMGFEM